MGYEKDVTTIVDAIKNRQTEARQTVMLSATLSNGLLLFRYYKLYTVYFRNINKF